MNGRCAANNVPVARPTAQAVAMYDAYCGKECHMTRWQC
jgi:hypothetical protein